MSPLNWVSKTLPPSLEQAGWTAFATGYAFAKAVLEFERARYGVKARASRVGEADCTP